MTTYLKLGLRDHAGFEIVITGLQDLPINITLKYFYFGTMVEVIKVCSGGTSPMCFFFVCELKSFEIYYPHAIHVRLTRKRYHGTNPNIFPRYWYYYNTCRSYMQPITRTTKPLYRTINVVRVL